MDLIGEQISFISVEHMSNSYLYINFEHTFVSHE